MMWLISHSATLEVNETSGLGKTCIVAVVQVPNSNPFVSKRALENRRKTARCSSRRSDEVGRSTASFPDDPAEDLKLAVQRIVAQ